MPAPSTVDAVKHLQRLSAVAVTVVAASLVLAGCQSSDAVLRSDVGYPSDSPSPNAAPQSTVSWRSKGPDGRLNLSTWGKRHCPLVPTKVLAKDATHLRIALSVDKGSEACGTAATLTTFIIVAPSRLSKTKPLHVTFSTGPSTTARP
jgi:hypothetical protein